MTLEQLPADTCMRKESSALIIQDDNTTTTLRPLCLLAEMQMINPQWQQIWPPTSLHQAGDIVTINGFFSHKVKTL